MMKTKSKLLKEAYPVLLFISLLMSWEITTQGSPSNQVPSIDSPRSWLHEALTGGPACKLPLLSASQPACLKEPARLTDSPLLERKLPWDSPAGKWSPKASAGWESL